MGGISTIDHLEAAGFVSDDGSTPRVNAATVAKALAQLTTATQVATGYQRDQFGPTW
ncbi:hypothetical protein [Glaciihabitans sp. UYNi722]|uniref:hypothetical protein n=1 Tax=Glaciihabitans sp. UYNi722 TaxID=3156344 RepID=UPI0033970C41